MLDRISFIFGEAFVGMRRNVTMTFASISTSAVALFLLGGLGYLYVGLNQLSDQVSGKFEMRAYLVEGVTAAKISESAKTIRAIPGVKLVAWIPKDKAWAKEKLKYPPEITEGIENPLPDALKITLSELDKADAVVQSVLKLDTIDKDRGVEYLKAEQQFVDQLRGLLRWLGTALGALLLVTSGILIYNSIRLTVVSRRIEMRIMHLVGASRITIRVPYLIEGMIHGILGGVFASTILLACQRALESRLHTLSSLSSLPSFPLVPMMEILVVVGAAYGCVCSVFALNVPIQGA